MTENEIKKNHRYGIILIAFFSGFITPPDTFTQIFVTLPMTILYEISVGTYLLLYKKGKIQDHKKGIAAFLTLLVLIFAAAAVYITTRGTMGSLGRNEMLMTVVVWFLVENVFVVISAFKTGMINGILSFLVPFYAAVFVIKKAGILFKNKIYWTLWAIFKIIVDIFIIVQAVSLLI